MGVSTKSYPFPVLGNEDDIKGKFNPSMTYTLEPNNVIVDCDFELSNPTVEDLIYRKKASYYVEIECPSTFFRRTFKTHNQTIGIEIEASDLREKVTVTFTVCADEDILNYSPEGVHPDLEGEPSTVERGDVLADGGTGWFTADKTFDPLKAPVSSFMKIQQGSKLNGPMTIDYADERIIIQLSKTDYKNYLFSQKYAISSLHSSLVLPALIDVLFTMKFESSLYQELPWFNRIQQIARERKIDLEEPITAAQRFLGEPVERGLRELKRILTDEEDE